MRLQLSMDLGTWLNLVAEINAVEFVPVDKEIAVNSTKLPGKFHKDPADRIIVATALKRGVPVVTSAGIFNTEWKGCSGRAAD